jgi:hypothetical protein
VSLPEGLAEQPRIRNSRLRHKARPGLGQIGKEKIRNYKGQQDKFKKKSKMSVEREWGLSERLPTGSPMQLGLAIHSHSAPTIAGQ